MLRHGGLWQETTPSWLGELPCSKMCSCEGKTPAVRMGKGSGVVRQQKRFSDCSEHPPDLSTLSPKSKHLLTVVRAEEGCVNAAGVLPHQSGEPTVN